MIPAIAVRSVLRAARGYSPALLARWAMPPRRFVIVTVGRSGSELLVSLLNSHPEIVCEGELLATTHASPTQFVRARAVEARLRGARAYGWKLLVGQFRNLRTTGEGDSDQLVHRFFQDGFGIIHLERRDHLQQSLSWHRAQQSGYHHDHLMTAAFAPEKVDPTTLLWATYANAEASEFLKRLVAPLPHLHITYEDDLLKTSCHQATLDRVFAYIGLETAPAKTDLVKITPQQTRDMVTNWDEIVALFRHSRYSDLVSDDMPSTVCELREHSE